MSWRTLLDLVALFNASKGVAHKHVRLRARQLDVLDKTSTLAYNVRGQRTRLCDALNAASFLASRLKASTPQWTGREPNSSSGFYPDNRDGSGSNELADEIAIETPKAEKTVKIRSIRRKDSGPEIRGPAALDLTPKNYASTSSYTLTRQSFDERGGIASFTELQEPRTSDVKTNTACNPKLIASLGRISEAQASSFSPEGENSRLKDGAASPAVGGAGMDIYQRMVEQEQQNLSKVDECEEGEAMKGRNILKIGTPTKSISQGESLGQGISVAKQSAQHELRESRVPSSRLGRLWNYGGLAAGMLGGAINEGVRRAAGGGSTGSYMLSANNMDRLVTKLSRMRGAALKLGQMISFQDSRMLPAAIQEVLQRVQDRADYMPTYQRDRVLVTNLGQNWRDTFSYFEEKPIAAASIGQVHKAILKSNGVSVAVKIQYPGVADSIDSDLNNLSLLLTASQLLPKGLFLNKTIENARTELAWECDYVREGECGRRFRHLLSDDKEAFQIPEIYPEASGKHVLTSEFMEGIGVTKALDLSQERKNWIGTQILRLCLREITEFRFMQTDPNWTNFLYNDKTKKLELLDFGASREYPERFILAYAKLLAAASRADREMVRNLSIDLRYLTGHESKTMTDAHIKSVLTLAEPFLRSSPEVYDFKDQTITERVKELIPVMIRERLAPPPEETYSLHRKLSGAFLLCARLGSQVRCRDLFENSMKKLGISQ